MSSLPFNTDIMDFFLNNRIGFLTAIFKFFTFLGDQNGYVLVVALVYTMVDKKLGFKIAMIASFTSMINHILKIIIRNPRPYVTDGSYKDNWAVDDIEGTADSFSTPSGHAMGSASMYSYLYVKVKNNKLRIVFAICILMIGLSRPYLGVHYIEDIIIGWILGFLMMYFFIKIENPLGTWWDSKGFLFQLIISDGIGFFTWLIAGLMTDWGTDGQNFATLTGFMVGFLIGRYFEMRYVDFDAASKSVVHKLIRYVLTIVLTIGTLLGLDFLFTLISGDDDSFLGFLLRYTRYFTVAFVAIFIAPLIFKNLKLSD